MILLTWLAVGGLAVGILGVYQLSKIIEHLTALRAEAEAIRQEMAYPQHDLLAAISNRLAEISVKTPRLMD